MVEIRQDTQIFTNNMTIYFYMFCAFMKNEILVNVEGDLIVTIKEHRLEAWNSNVLKEVLSKVSS